MFSNTRTFLGVAVLAAIMTPSSGQELVLNCFTYLGGSTVSQCFNVGAQSCDLSATNTASTVGQPTVANCISAMNTVDSNCPVVC
ncbi:hypothetical protein B0H17DRAFT_1206791 [Mycena rosella]|uniref:Glycan binding protein Y3-like domain-containing protein n=1 Tax=Mycena rosella TaxID=1033263 RepID=A0AAD7G8V4_MYCRO|nr:hypothetical protein B0H17DRAFT_1206791 [Mycena rosella]